MKYFNFNNEEYTLPIEVNEDGVSIEIEGQTLEFDSVQELAENYAVARNVNPENLKNWVLVQEGDYYSFILKAATAGADEESEESEDNEESEEYEESDEYDCDEYDYEYVSTPWMDDENFFDEAFGRPFSDFEKEAYGEYIERNNIDAGLTSEELNNSYGQIKADFLVVLDHLKNLASDVDKAYLFYDYCVALNKGELPKGFEKAKAKLAKQLVINKVSHRSSFQIFLLDFKNYQISPVHITDINSLDGDVYICDNRYFVVKDL